MRVVVFANMVDYTLVLISWGSVLHYDLTPDIRAVAVANGAAEVSIDRLRREGLARQCLRASTAGNGR